MANVRRETVSYQPFRTQPLLADGLLPVSRPGGELLDKVSSAFFRLADEAGRRADQETFDRYSRASRQAAVDGAPGASLEGVGETGAEAPPMQASARELAARGKAYLMRKYGVSNEFASGLLGQFSGESNFNVNAINRNDGADGSHSIGIGQWNGARARALKAFAGAQGKPVNDFETQLDFAMHELHTSEGGVGRRLSAARTVEEAVAAGVGYERPQGWLAANPRGALGWNHRLAAARSIAGIGIDGVPADVGADTGAAPYVAPGLSFTGGTWRPMAGNTLAARAWNDAGSKVYLAELNTEIISTIGQAFELYKDDPAALEKTLTSLKAATAKEHVFPEILPEYSVGFDRQAAAALEQSRRIRADRLESQDRADVFERSGEIRTNVLRQAGQYDPDNPDTLGVLTDGLASIDANYDGAVARGIMSPEAAAKAKADNRRDVATTFYTEQAQRLPADEVAALHEKMRGDFSAGKLDGIDGGGWLDLDAKLQSIENAKRSGAASARARLQKAGDDFAERARMGYAIDQQAYSDFTLQAGAAENGAAIVDATGRKIAAANTLRELPVSDGQAYVDKIRAAIGDNPSAEDIGVLDFAEKTLAARQKAIETDPLGEAQRSGYVKLDPIDASSPETLAASMAARQQAARETAGRFGVPVSIYRPEELKAVKSDIKSTDPRRYSDAMAQLEFAAQADGMKEVQETFGDDAAGALQDWQARLRYGTQDEVAAWLKERADPKWQERIKPLVTKGESEARKVAFEDVVKKLDENRFVGVNAPVDGETRRMLMNDFVELVGQRYAVTGEVGAATDQAIERMRKVWGTTAIDGTRGGRLMAYPPEENYPNVGGGQGWLASQFGDLAKERGTTPENLSLVADGKTKAAADSGQQPGYLVSVLNPSTGFDELVTDGAGKPMRFFFDPEAAQQKALANATEERRTRDDPWIVINEGTSIGPFYPPWAPPDAETLRHRQQRIKEIAGEQDKSRADRMEEHRRVREVLREQREKN